MEANQPTTKVTSRKKQDTKRHIFIGLFSAILTPLVVLIFNKAGLTHTGYWIIGLILVGVVMVAFMIERNRR